MRLPAVAIAAAFACGILLGLHPVVARNATSLLMLSSSFAIIAVLVVTGLLFVKTSRLFLAAIASLLSWVVLGFLGVCIAEQPRDPDYVISLIEQGRLPYMC
jgi:putative Mn2+ efflux pump MntP